MPTLTEKLDSREWTTGERPSATLCYSLTGVADDLTAKTLVRPPTAVYIEKVYEDGSFAGLGIGT